MRFSPRRALLSLLTVSVLLSALPAAADTSAADISTAAQPPFAPPAVSDMPDVSEVHSFEPPPAFSDPHPPFSPLIRPFANDPLGVVAHFGLAVPPPLWLVTACDMGTGFYLPDPTQAVSEWGPPVVSWFDWTSGGLYSPELRAGPTVSASTLSACTSESAKLLSDAERASGAAVITLTNRDPSHHDTGGAGGATGWGLSRAFSVEAARSRHGRVFLASSTPYVRFVGDGVDEAYRWSLLVHEMGHAIGWHHTPYSHSSNPYSFPGDVMSGIRRAPTHVFNRYRTGWLPPDRVVFHSSTTQVVELGYPHSGLPEMLLLADPSAPGRLFAVGVNPGADFAAFSSIATETGVDVLSVDQSLASPHSSYAAFCPTLSRGVGMCALLGVDTRYRAASKVADFTPSVLRPGDSLDLSGVRLEVLSQTDSGFRLSLSGTPAPFWGRDFTLAPTSGWFSDVSPSHIFFADVNALAAADITRGCNPPTNSRFCPDQPVTRGQMAAFLTRALSLPAGSEGFSDTEGHLFRADVAALARADITRGCNPPANSRFCPDRPVTRGEMAAFLRRALQLPQGSKVFTDTAGHLFEADVAALEAAGITRGCNPPDNSRFCPDRPVTRGEMAAFLVRAGLLP